MIGAVICVKSKSSSALARRDLAADNCASACFTLALSSSTRCLETACVLYSSIERVESVLAKASVASRSSTVAFAMDTSALNGRGSIENNKSPLLTISPSLKWIFSK